MIKEQELIDAIAECQGQRNPDAQTCIMLAAFLIIKDKYYPDEQTKAEIRKYIPSYSFSAPPAENEEVINYQSETEFGQMIEGKNANEMWALIDELMSTIQVLQPKLYNSIMRRMA